MQNATDAAWGRWLPAYAAVKAVDESNLIRDCISDDEFAEMVDRRREAIEAVLAAPVATLTDVARKLAVIATDYDDGPMDLSPHVDMLLLQVARAEEKEAA